MKKESVYKAVEIVIIVALLSFVYLRNLESIEFHIDESHWIGTSYMFEAYVKGEFWSDAWRDSHRTVTNPPIPRYIIGVGRFIGGYHINDLNRPWEYTRGLGFNLRKGAMPSAGLLWWSRLPMAILAILSILIGFFFIKRIAGRPASYLWVGFALISSYLLLQTRRAMAESPILFFSMLGILLCYFALQQIQADAGKIRWKTVIYLTGTAVCIACAGESKMNGLSILAAVIVCVILAIARQKDGWGQKIWRSVFSTFLLVFVTAIVFLGLYPYLWVSPIARTSKMLTDRVAEMERQTITHPADKIDTLRQRVTIIPTEIFEGYAVIHFAGSLVLNILLSLLGVGILGSQAVNWLRKKSDDPASFLLLSAAAVASFPTFFTLLDWDRYYLFPVFFSTIFVAIALGWIVTKIYHQIKPQLAQPAI